MWWTEMGGKMSAGKFFKKRAMEHEKRKEWQRDSFDGLHSKRFPILHTCHLTCTDVWLHESKYAPSSYLRIEAICWWICVFVCVCFTKLPKRDHLSVVVIKELLNCQMGGEGRKKGSKIRWEMVRDRERVHQEKIELFSFLSIIQDVYYLLVCAAANFMPKHF